jgi:tetratricopeptide (TPR) repeat protein
VTAYSALALSRYFLGQFGRARQDCQVGIDLAERIQSWRMLGYLHGYFGLIELSNGNTDAAILHAEQAIEMGERFKHSETAAGGYRILGDIFFVLQAHEQAAGYYRLGRQASQNQFLAVDQLVRLGASLCMCGRLEEGRACIQEAVEQAQGGGLGVALISAQIGQAHANLMQGQFGRAYQMAIALVGETRRRSLPASRLMIVFLLGMADEQAGEIEKAIERFQTAASEAACLPDPWIEQQAQAELGRLLAKAGRPDPAALERARFLMDYLDEHARHPLVRQAFLSFRQRIESRIA